MKAYEWIDRLKVKNGWESDYRVAKELGFKPNTISTYRAHGTPMDETIAVKVARALGINPAGLVLDQVAERIKDTETRATLSAEAARLCILCKVTAAILFGAAKPRQLKASH